jgi:hypothetical protein
MLYAENFAKFAHILFLKIEIVWTVVFHFLITDGKFNVLLQGISHLHLAIILMLCFIMQDIDQ